MRVLCLDFLLMKIGKIGRSSFELFQTSPTCLALGNVLTHLRRVALRKLLVREQKKLFVR